MIYKAINVETSETVTGVGYCPSNSESWGNYELEGKLGYLFKSNNMHWEDVLEFTYSDDFYIVYADSVTVIDDTVTSNSEYKDIIKNYNDGKQKLQDLSFEIFKYLKQYPNLLKFEVRFVAYSKFVTAPSNFVIWYYDKGYDVYDSSFFEIPYEHIYNNTWKEYIDNKNEEVCQKKYEDELKEQKRIEDAERKRYEELKAKFENK